MTREEQLACLEDRPCAVCKFHTDGCSRWACVFEEKPEEQEPCKDCISREAVKKLKKYRFSYDTNTTIPKSDVFVKISDIADLPSIALQRPKGHWIPIHPLQEDDEGAYMCSCCRVGDWGIDPKVDKCCFNCGADMRGDEE